MVLCQVRPPSVGFGNSQRTSQVLGHHFEVALLWVVRRAAEARAGACGAVLAMKLWPNGNGWVENQCPVES